MYNELSFFVCAYAFKEEQKVVFEKETNYLDKGRIIRMVDIAPQYQNSNSLAKFPCF